MELLRISEDTMIICIPDVKTLKQLMREFDVIGCKNVKVILDRGFSVRKTSMNCSANTKSS